MVYYNKRFSSDDKIWFGEIKHFYWHEIHRCYCCCCSRIYRLLLNSNHNKKNKYILHAKNGPLMLNFLIFFAFILSCISMLTRNLRDHQIIIWLPYFYGHYIGTVRVWALFAFVITIFSRNKYIILSMQRCPNIIYATTTTEPPQCVIMVSGSVLTVSFSFFTVFYSCTSTTVVFFLSIRTLKKKSDCRFCFFTTTVHMTKLHLTLICC